MCAVECQRQLSKVHFSYLSAGGVWSLLCNLSEGDNVVRTLFLHKSRALPLLVAVYYKFEMCVVVCHAPQNNFWRRCLTLELCFEFPVQLYRVDNVGNKPAQILLNCTEPL